MPCREGRSQWSMPPIMTCVRLVILQDVGPWAIAFWCGALFRIFLFPLLIPIKYETIDTVFHIFCGNLGSHSLGCIFFRPARDEAAGHRSVIRLGSQNVFSGRSNSSNLRTSATLICAFGSSQGLPTDSRLLVTFGWLSFIVFCLVRRRCKGPMPVLRQALLADNGHSHTPPPRPPDWGICVPRGFSRRPLRQVLDLCVVGESAKDFLTDASTSSLAQDGLICKDGPGVGLFCSGFPHLGAMSRQIRTTKCETSPRSEPFFVIEVSAE